MIILMLGNGNPTCPVLFPQHFKPLIPKRTGRHLYRYSLRLRKGLRFKTADGKGNLVFLRKGTHQRLIQVGCFATQRNVAVCNDTRISQFQKKARHQHGIPPAADSKQDFIALHHAYDLGDKLLKTAPYIHTSKVIHYSYPLHHVGSLFASTFVLLASSPLLLTFYNL